MPAGIPDITPQLHLALQTALDAGTVRATIVTNLHASSGCQEYILAAHLAEKRGAAGTAGETADLELDAAAAAAAAAAATALCDACEQAETE